MGTARRHDWRTKIARRKTYKWRSTFLWCPAVILLLLAACRFNPDIRNDEFGHLYGTWVQDSVAMQDRLLQYTLHEFRFTADSVYVTLRTTASVKKIADACYGDGHWTEYTRGQYIVRGDSLLVEGWYREPDGRLKTAGCHHIGKYRPRLGIVYQSPDSLALKNPLDQHVISLRRVITD